MNSNMVPLNEKLEKCIKELCKDRECLVEIYNLTKTSVYSFAISILKNANDAEDILQETYIRVYQNADKYEAKGKPLAWILTITRNLAFMNLRNKKEEVDILEISDILPDSTKYSSEDKILINTLINFLTKEERQIISLHVISGFKHREISKILDIPISTCLSKYNRAIKKLRDKMKNEFQYN